MEHEKKYTRLSGAINMEQTLFCGQCFHWQAQDRGYIGCVNGNAAFIERAGDAYAIHSSESDAYWHNYFDMDRDYDAIAKRYAFDAHVQAAFHAFDGLRVLRQPVWETLCAFIISTNNNVKRISGIMQRLSLELGQEQRALSHAVHAFPPPEAIARAGEARLRALGLGYRAPFLLEAARKVESGYELAALCTIGYEDALNALLSFKGVGEKVADCVLLFACGYPEAFPIDVWMRRVMTALYQCGGSDRALKAEGMRMFGADAGVVQQVLFHGARSGLFASYI